MSQQAYLADIGLQLGKGEGLPLGLPLQEEGLLPQLVLAGLQLVSALRAGQSHLALHVSSEQGLLLPQSCHLAQCLHQTTCEQQIIEEEEEFLLLPGRRHPVQCLHQATCEQQTTEEEK